MVICEGLYKLLIKNKGVQLENYFAYLVKSIDSDPYTVPSSKVFYIHNSTSHEQLIDEW